MKATATSHPGYYVLAFAALIAAGSSCLAETKVGRGGKAGKAPAQLNAFIVIDATSASAQVSREGLELAIRQLHLPQAAGLAGWTDFSRTASGGARLESDNRFGFEVIESGDAEDDGSVRAFRLSLDGVSASGGSAYAVSFAASDLSGASAGIQPAVYAAVAAATASGKKSGQVRIVAAKYSGGRFTFSLAIK
jgi:hypothetical protein